MSQSFRHCSSRWPWPPRRPSGSRSLFDTPEADRIVASLQVFPTDNPWNQDVSALAGASQFAEDHRLDRRGQAAADQQRHGLYPRAADQKRVPVKIVAYPASPTKAPTPCPSNVPIEGWPVNYQDKTGLALATCSATGSAKTATATPSSSIRRGAMLYEFYQMKRTDAGWQAAQASIFDLKTNKLRPDGWTSTDAAGPADLPGHRPLRRVAARHGRPCHAGDGPPQPPGLRRAGDAFRQPLERPQPAADGRADSVSAAIFPGRLFARRPRRS